MAFASYTTSRDTTNPCLKVGELTMDTELLQTKIARLEAGGTPFAARRSKR